MQGWKDKTQPSSKFLCKTIILHWYNFSQSVNLVVSVELFSKIDVVGMMEQCVRDKKSFLVLNNFAQNECACWYWPSVWLKMNRGKHTPSYENDTKWNQIYPMETTYFYRFDPRVRKSLKLYLCYQQVTRFRV